MLYLLFRPSQCFEIPGFAQLYSLTGELLIDSICYPTRKHHLTCIRLFIYLSLVQWSSIAIAEMHGPSLDAPSKGWILACNKNVNDPAHCRVKLNAIAAILQEVETSLTLQEGDCLAAFCIDLAKRLVEPLVLHERELKQSPGSQAAISRYFIHCRYHELAGDALAFAADIVTRMIQADAQRYPEQSTHLRNSFNCIRSRVKTLTSHPFTNGVVDYASQLGVPLHVLHEDIRGWPLLQLGMGGSSRIVCSTSNDADSFIGGAIARNKSQSQAILARLGFPVPRSVSLPTTSSDQQFTAAAHAVGYPCVVKPNDTELGVGVTIGIIDSEGLIAAVELAKKHTRSRILVEQFVSGDYHRLVILSGQLVRVLRMQPPALIGDGRRSIQQILDEEEASEDELKAFIYASQKPHLSDEVIKTLRKQNLTPHSIPAAGARVTLRHNLTDRSDWSYKELLNQVDNSLHTFARAIASSLGLSNAGIDILSADITQPVYQASLSLIEINAIQRLNPKWAKAFTDQLRLNSWADSFLINVLVLSPSPGHSVGLLAKSLSLGEYQGCTVAIPKSLLPQLDPALLGQISDQMGLLVYSHPREVLLNRALKSILFLIGIQDLMDSGLPAPVVNRVQLCGALPTALQGAWQGLLRRVLPSCGEDAFCDIDFASKPVQTTL